MSHSKMTTPCVAEPTDKPLENLRDSKLQLSASAPSICIPRTFPNITWKRVKGVFEELLGDGCIDRVDCVNRTSKEGDDYIRVFVHFRYWPSTPDAQAFREKLLDGESIQLVYDDPWYWKCSASRVTKPSNDAPRRARAPPRLVLNPPRAPADRDDDAADDA